MEYVGREGHTEFAKRIEDEQHRQNRRIELLEESVKQNTALTVSVEKLANNMESMTNEVSYTRRKERKTIWKQLYQLAFQQV